MEKITVKELLKQFNLHPPEDMNPCKRLYDIFKALLLNRSAQARLVNLPDLSLAGDGTPVYTAAQERKKSTCGCLKRGFGTVNVTVSTASLTVTSGGIPTGNVTISAMTCTCSPPRIRKMTCPFSLSSAPLPDMIPLASFIAGSP